MDVLLIYKCSGCCEQSTALVTDVAVKDHLQLEMRLPAHWVVKTTKKGHEIYFCAYCMKAEKREDHRLAHFLVEGRKVITRDRTDQ